jgi:mono/diheme cytochrome c family protein
VRSLIILYALSAFTQSPAFPQTPEGQRLFSANRSTCHGADAHGARGPDLTSGALRYGSSVAEIAKNIHDGIAGTGMPAFPLTGDQPRQIADWLLSVTRGKDTSVTETLPADAPSFRQCGMRGVPFHQPRSQGVCAGFVEHRRAAIRG